jgi:hypothetical protein
MLGERLLLRFRIPAVSPAAFRAWGSGGQKRRSKWSQQNLIQRIGAGMSRVGPFLRGDLN